VVSLPFDVPEVVDDLRFDLYMNSSGASRFALESIDRIYYFLRPSLPVRVRKYLQRVRLRDWNKLLFSTLAG
jgi:hypothetical protein